MRVQFESNKLLTSGILVQQRLEIGVENLQKKSGILTRISITITYILNKYIVDIY